ncbi:MAG: biotin--[acetyl-CoA-carboxylase] ligase [Thermodesulfobacteriota bacterium]
MADERWRQLLGQQTVGGRRLLYLAEAESTNTLALSRAEAGLLIIADTQTGGRGRWSRNWHSPAGEGLYCSLTTRPQAMDPGELPRLTLAAGLAVAEAVEALTGVLTGIKWPNDIQIDGRKVAGILMETSLTGRNALLVTGIGVNVTTTAFPAAIADKAGSLLSTTGRHIDRGLLLEEILRTIDRWFAAAAAGDYAGVLAAWRRRDVCRDRRLHWLSSDGAVIAGVACGIDEQGCLLIRDDQGRLHSVLSGDVQPVAAQK